MELELAFFQVLFLNRAAARQAVLTHKNTFETGGFRDVANMFSNSSFDRNMMEVVCGVRELELPIFVPPTPFHLLSPVDQHRMTQDMRKKAGMRAKRSEAIDDWLARNDKKDE